MADKTVYFAYGLIGGGANDLDFIDGSVLLDQDVAHVYVSNALYIYLLDATSGAGESSPDIISPDANAGTKRWILQTPNRIKFPATAVPSADPNTLDDYEEGYATSITLTCGTSGTITVDTNFDTLAYTKIGRVVHIQGAITSASVSSPVGILTFNGLPFTVTELTEAAETGSFEVPFFALGSAVALGIVGYPLAGATTLTLREQSTTTTVNDLSNHIAANTWLYFNFNYISE